ncbi:general stress protein CsbD [Methylobacterium sp. Leaf87]|uniref:CsbD family protein n=1 Tax=Methylobacterium sp. Leaf87 TaxID=1736243 RepID=UPI0006FE7601|nr:CsbD family protein [Methylobacterium sp. Leaf87]KQO56197.1 general stress protein CsbD [Methylobacterium sp. Leaf87]
MNSDQFRGATRHLKGRAQSTLGGITGDPARQVRGAVDQVAGGAQYAYGQAHDRAKDWIEDGSHLAHEARRRGERLLDDGSRYARETRRRGEAYGRQAVGYADANRGATVLALAALAFAAGWLLRPSR